MRASLFIFYRKQYYPAYSKLFIHLIWHSCSLIASKEKMTLSRRTVSTFSITLKKIPFRLWRQIWKEVLKTVMEDSFPLQQLFTGCSLEKALLLICMMGYFSSFRCQRNSTSSKIGCLLNLHQPHLTLCCRHPVS